MSGSQRTTRSPSSEAARSYGQLTTSASPTTRNLRRSGRHDHDVSWCHSQRTMTLQVWPWHLAESTAHGAVTFKAA
eukprot:6165654-Pyramimonas_sp.AAC.1